MAMGMLKGKREVLDWDKYPLSVIRRDVKLYVDVGWVKRFRDTVVQYEMYSKVLNNVIANREKMVDSFLENVRLRDFLIIHSGVSEEDTDSKDWLVRYMSKALLASSDDIERLHEKHNIPNDIMKKLSMFDPDPCYKIDRHPLSITYGMWQKDEYGRVVDPIRVNNDDWDAAERSNMLYIRDFLSSYDSIDLSVWVPPKKLEPTIGDPSSFDPDSISYLIEDDLPF